uniref:Arb2 domain-containing protein n=2 Tax=Timema TaxID=61471 RepID=A0A7R9IR37_9NEOP|nr:unnamed protein product [Timema tahoe]
MKADTKLVLNEHVYGLLETETKLYKLPVPIDTKAEARTHVFVSVDIFSNTDKLLILVHGSGVVRAGQWARSIIINESLQQGSMLPYIKKARELGYAVLITNTNDNFKVLNGKKINIKGSADPKDHLNYVWKHYVKDVKAKHIAIVAHSYGGFVTVGLTNIEINPVESGLSYRQVYKTNQMINMDIERLGLARRPTGPRAGAPSSYSSLRLRPELHLLAKKNSNDAKRHLALRWSRDWTQMSSTLKEEYSKDMDSESEISEEAEENGKLKTCRMQEPCKAKDHFSEFKERVFAVAFTDSVHSMSLQKVPKKVIEFLQKAGRNWVAHDEPLDTPVKAPANEITRVSAGHIQHEMTSWSCMESLFTFLQERYAFISGDKEEL